MRLFAMQNLTLQYVDTVTDYCVEKRISGTKPLVRAVRELRRGIDRLYASSFKGEAGRLAKESEASNAAEFEDNAEGLLTRLFYGLDTEVGRLGLTDDHKALVIAVHQALTIADVTRMYAREDDAEEEADDSGDRFQLAVAFVHTKTVHFETLGGRKIVIHGSANLRTSGNVEQFTVEENAELHDFYEETFRPVIDRFKTINRTAPRKTQWADMTTKHFKN